MDIIKLFKQARIIVPLSIAMAITICGVIFYSLSFLRDLSGVGQIATIILAPAILLTWLVSVIFIPPFDSVYTAFPIIIMFSMFSIIFWFFSISFTQILYVKWKTLKKSRHLIYLIIWLLLILLYISWTMIGFSKFAM